jgi:hypothetical protein
MINTGLLAQKDQRIAGANRFLVSMIKIWKEDFAPSELDEAIAVCQLSAFLDEELTAPRALSDVLVLAIKRLAS